MNMIKQMTLPERLEGITNKGRIETEDDSLFIGEQALKQFQELKGVYENKEVKFFADSKVTKLEIE